MIARRVRVTGRVQGVFFRAWTRQQAQALGVAGWVRNCDDGSVEAHVEGEGAAVDRLVERLAQGPQHARVDDLQVDDARPECVPKFLIFE
ncbi:MAG: acylphosphatase [Pseudomonadota bacterium]